VNSVDVNTSQRGTSLTLKTTGDFDYLAYQTDNEYVVSIKPLTKAEAEERRNEFNYVGERISLNFQDIEVRAVLQLIADFTELEPRCFGYRCRAHHPAPEKCALGPGAGAGAEDQGAGQAPGGQRADGRSRGGNCRARAPGDRGQQADCRACAPAQRVHPHSLRQRCGSRRPVRGRLGGGRQPDLRSRLGDRGTAYELADRYRDFDQARGDPRPYRSRRYPDPPGHDRVAYRYRAVRSRGGAGHPLGWRLPRPGRERQYPVRIRRCLPMR
jgi:hypothetical protein